MVGPRADIEITRAMTESLRHRGPDGLATKDLGEAVLGHTRLSIIDLVTGDQPMSNEDESIWVVYNGEIYNFPELRDELVARGHTFRTTSDTEVLVHGYEEFGVDFLPRLDGIFAFALWDAAQRQLLLVRDYFGVKPLHVHFDGATLRFASELKALLQDRSLARDVDFQALHYFMNLRYIPGQRTLLEGFHRLLPGEYLILRPGGHVSRCRYHFWTPPRQTTENASEAMEGIRHYLHQAVKKQMIADVPVGLYLSGGLDSSSLAAYLAEEADQPVSSFTLGFNEPTDELDDARLVARHFGTDHHEMSLDLDALKHYPEVVWFAEEPKENVLQGYLLARFASQSVKVVMGGLGGDELLAGYTVNRFMYPVRNLHNHVAGFLSRGALPWLSGQLYKAQKATGKLSWDEYRRGGQLALALGDPCRYYQILRNVWDFDPGAWQLYGPAWLGRPIEPVDGALRPWFDMLPGQPQEQMLWTELQTKMIDDFLMNEDRTSMANGLEVRVPFLDRDLVNFALTIPAELKMEGNHTKDLFRKAMKGILPPRAIKKKKWGFTFNPYLQFQKDLKDVAGRILTRERVMDRGWFDYKFLKAIMDHPAHPRLRWHYFMLWLALGLEIWARLFLEGDPTAPELNLEAHYA